MVATIYVVYYSTHGHIEKLARKVVNGLEKAGVNAKLFQVAETLSDDILQKMHAKPKATDVPVITPDQLAEAGQIQSLNTFVFILKIFLY